MKVYFLVDQPDLADKESDFIAELTEWVAENSAHATLVNELEASGDLGMTLSIKAAKNLVAPLKKLYSMAKSYKCDFVVGYFEGEEREDVCFFGNEEGRADAFEVACYLGMD